MGSHAARRSRKMGLRRGCSWKSRLIVFVLVMACANSQDISACCAKATGTCRSVCEKMSLVEIASNSSMREERIQNIYKFCTPSLIEFWICMNVTIQGVVSGSGWWGRACCALGRSAPCRQACATAAGAAALAPVCRRSDEIAFFNCVKRQEEAQTCCSQTQSLTCHEACQRVLWRVGTARLELSARERAVEVCEQSPPLLRCLRDLTASTVHADASKYLPCCHESPSQECRTSCESVLRRTGDSQEIAETLDQDCGGPAIHDGLWQCFLRKDEPPDTKDLIPHDVAKLHCCSKATTINCRKLCFNTFNTDWQNNWQKFYADCIGDPQETALSQCVEEVEAPCSLGCAGLTYCSQLNNRPTSLFRSCSAQADLDAHLAVAEQKDNGYVSVSGLRLPLKNSSQCPTDIWKSVACALHVKPCTAKGHASLLCAADCARLVSSCVEWARAPPALNAAALCARLAPPAAAAPCVSLADYMSPSKYEMMVVQGHASLLCAADCARLVSSCVEWARAPPALNAAALCARLAPPAAAAPCVSLADYMSPSKYEMMVVQGHASLLCAADCARLVSSCVEWARAPPALNAAALCARLAPPAAAAPCVSLADYMSPSKYEMMVVQGHASLLCAADCARLVSSCVEWARAPPALNAAALCARLAPPAAAAPCVLLADYMSPSKYEMMVVQGHASLLCAADCARLVSSCVEWARAPPALNAAALCARLAPPAAAAPCVSLADYMSHSKYEMMVVQGHASLLCAADCARLVSSCVEWARAPPALNAAALCARLAPPAAAAPCVSLADYMSPSKYEMMVVQGHASLLCAADCARLVSSCVEWARAPPALNAAALCARLAPPAAAAPCVSLADYMSPSKYEMMVVQGHASLLCAADCARLVSSCVEWARAPPALNAAALCARLAPPAAAAPCVLLADYMSPSKYEMMVVQGHASLLCAADCARLVSSCVEWARAPPALNAAALCARLAPPAAAAPCVSLAHYMSHSKYEMMVVQGHASLLCAADCARLVSSCVEWARAPPALNAAALCARLAPPAAAAPCVSLADYMSPSKYEMMVVQGHASLLCAADCARLVSSCVEWARAPPALNAAALCARLAPPAAAAPCVSLADYMSPSKYEMMVVQGHASLLCAADCARLVSSCVEWARAPPALNAAALCARLAPPAAAAPCVSLADYMSPSNYEMMVVQGHASLLCAADCARLVSSCVEWARAPPALNAAALCARLAPPAAAAPCVSLADYMSPSKYEMMVVQGHASLLCAADCARLVSSCVEWARAPPALNAAALCARLAPPAAAAPCVSLADYMSPSKYEMMVVQGHASLLCAADCARLVSSCVEWARAPPALNAAALCARLAPPAAAAPCVSLADYMSPSKYEMMVVQGHASLLCAADCARLVSSCVEWARAPPALNAAALCARLAPPAAAAPCVLLADYMSPSKYEMMVVQGHASLLCAADCARLVSSCVEWARAPPALNAAALCARLAPPAAAAPCVSLADYMSHSKYEMMVVQGHASLLCAADCARLVSSCVEWARAPPALNAAALCARLAPPAAAAPCVSLADYMSPSKYEMMVVQGHASLLCAADCARLVSSCVEWARAPPALNAAALCARLAPPAAAAPCVSLADYMSPSKYEMMVVQGHASLLCAADCARLVSSCVEWARAPPALNAAALCARLAPPAAAAPCVLLADYMSPSKYEMMVVQGHASLLCAADCARLVSSCVEWARAPPALNAAALCARLAPPAAAAPCVSLAHYMSHSKYEMMVVQGHASLLCAADCARLVSSCVEWARAPPALNAAALCARLAPPAAAAPCVSLADYMSPSKYEMMVVQGHASLLCAADCARLVSSCVEWARAPPALNAAALCARLAPPAAAAPCVSLADYMSPSKYEMMVVQGHASLLCAADCARLVSSCVEWARAPPALNAAALCARLAPPAAAAPCVSLADYMSPSKYEMMVVQGHASLLCAADCARLVSSCVEWARAPPALNAAALCARLAPPAAAAPCVSLADYMSPSKYEMMVVQGHASLLCAADCARLVSSCVEWARAPPALNAAALCARLAPPAAAAPCVSLADYMSPSLDPPLLSSREAVTSPCAGSPCNATQVCLVNRNCLQGGSCSRYTCTDGCPLGSGSQYVVPLGSWARVPMSSPSGKACYKICHCTNKGLGQCQPLPCVALDNCRLHDKVIMHGEKYYMECNACACAAGERVCARRACGGGALLTGLPCNCPPHHLPVRAPGRRFPNACLAKCAGATDGEIEFGIRSVCASAACGRRACLPARNVCLSRLQASCPQHVCVNTSHCNAQPPMPVCDTDGRTHGNPCHLVISGNRFAYWGQCLERCSKVGSVCGVNGITYISECAAWSEYVSVDYRGPCLAVGSISDLMEPKCLMDIIYCPPLIKPGCLGFTAPGACCPKCGGALRILYSKKQIDRALYGTNISSSVINLKNVLSALDRQVKIAECALRGYLTIEMEIFVTVETILENPTDLQLRVCVLEAEKLAELINRESPIISSDLGLSALSYALTVHTYPSKGGTSLSVSLLAVMISCISIVVLR